jgi:hypothetical protein
LSDPPGTLVVMATWNQIVSEAPQFAQRVRDVFDVRKHKTLATLRADGSPRISGIEIEFGPDEVRFGSMPDARKAHDLRRDPRLAVHSPTVDPPEGDAGGWAGEAKITGRAVAEPVDPPPPEAPVGGRFHIDISEVVLTYLDATGHHLVIESWHSGRGWERRTRQ